MTSYWLDQNIKTVAVLILCNAYVHLTKLECMYHKNILKMHLKRCQRLKNNCGFCEETSTNVVVIRGIEFVQMVNFE